MNLVLDQGNTGLKAGIFQDSQLLEKVGDLSSSGLEVLLKKYNPSRAIISLVKETDFAIPVNCLKLDYNTPLPVRNDYRSPRTLGPDRLAAAVGANFLFPDKNCLVIDTGTCITMDFMDKNGSYKGGSISPGIDMRFKALHNFTGRLPLVNRKNEFQLTGSDTEGSILSGVLNGVLAEVKGIAAAYRASHSDLHVIICGGDAAFFESNIKEPIFVIPELVLTGLNRILEYNAAKI